MLLILHAVGSRGVLLAKGNPKSCYCPAAPAETATTWCSGLRDRRAVAEDSQYIRAEDGCHCRLRLQAFSIGVGSGGGDGGGYRLWGCRWRANAVNTGSV